MDLERDPARPWGVPGNEEADDPRFGDSSVEPPEDVPDDVLLEVLGEL